MNKILENTNVYRFESREVKYENTNIGIGAYRLDTIKLSGKEYKLFDEMCYEHADQVIYPNIFLDLDVTFYNEELQPFEYFSSCPTLNDLLNWFKGYVDFLLEKDFIIVKYKVREAVLGFSQIQSFFKNSDILKKEIIME